MDTVFRYFINKLTTSITFKKNEKFKRLLKYYEKMYLSNNFSNISEKTIAFDILGKSLSFDPAYDSSVRVFLLRFKKRLKLYYLTEGINDDYVLSYQYGSYNPVFIKNIKNFALGSIYPKKNIIEEQILVSLAGYFTMTNDEFYLDKMLEYHKQIDQSIAKENPFIISIIAETQLNKLSLFGSKVPNPIKKIEYDIEKANMLDKNDPQVIFSNIIYHLYVKDFKKVILFAEQLEVASTHPYYIRLSYLVRALVYNDTKYLENVESYCKKYNQYMPYLYIPIMLSAMRNNDNIGAIHYAQLFSYNNSFHSKIYLILLKAKLNNLCFEDENFIEENSLYFSEQFLQHCIFELAVEYAIT